MKAATSQRLPVFVISLEESTDRRAAFAERAAKTDMEWRFFPACRNLIDGLTYRPADAIVDKGRPLKTGELGCYASHFAIWTLLVTNHVNQAIVLEDDVIADWALLAKLAAVDFAALKLDYVRLFGKNYVKGRILQNDFVDRARILLDYRGHTWGTQGYVITLAGAKHFIKACTKVSRPIDDELDRSWAHGMPNLAIFPFPLIEETIPSLIGAERFEPYPVPPELRVRRFLSKLRERYLRLKQVVTRYGLRERL